MRMPMAPLLIWTAVIAAASCIGIGAAAMPLLPEGLPLSPAQAQALVELIQLWQAREMEHEQRDMEQQQVHGLPLPQALPMQELRQLKQWVEMQLEDPAPVLSTPAPPLPKRGNYMALCHFKICNMGRKRSPRAQTQDLP